MRSLWPLLVVIAAGCKDDSGTARPVSAKAPASSTVDDAPEPPGGPPSCADVGQHLAGAVAVPKEVHAEVKGADVAVSGDVMARGIEQGVAVACRKNAWSRDARACAMTWTGNILNERASLRASCPGTVK